MTHQVDIPESDRIAAENQQWIALADDLTHDMYVLREILLADAKSVSEGEKNTFKKFLDDFLRLDFETNKSDVRDRIFNEAVHIITIFNRPDLAETLLLDDQVQHRQEDLMRIIEYFAKNNNLDAIRRIVNVDLAQPLESQIELDPDYYS